MRARGSLTTLLVVGALALAACGEPAGDPGPSTTGETLGSTATTAGSSESADPSGDPVPESNPSEPDDGQPEGLSEAAASIVDAAITDLADRLRTPRDTIEVLSVEPMLWNDGSLGCPEPGVAYTQAVVEGYWILLSADGNAYDYRASDNGFVKLCESGPAPTTAPSS